MKHGSGNWRVYAAKAVALILIAIPVLTSCGGGGGGGEVTPEGEDAIDITVMTNREVAVNPTESILYAYTDEDGSRFTYFGNRDTDGLPLVIKTLFYEGADGNEYEISYNDDGMPFKIKDNDGTELELEFIEDEATVASLSTTISETQTAVIQAVGASIRGIRLSEDGTPVEIQVTVSPEVKGAIQRDQELISAYRQQPFGNVHISVSSCGQLVNPAGGVKVHVGQRHADYFDESYWAFPVSKGRYVTNIPQIASFSGSAKDMCDSFASLVSGVCNVTNPNVTSVATAKMASDPTFYVPICTSLALKSGAAFAHVETLCIGMFSIGNAVCNTIGKDAKPKEGYYNIPDIDRDNIAQAYICPNIEGVLNAYDSVQKLAPAEHYKTIQAVAYFDASDERKVGLSEQEDIVISDPIYPILSVETTETAIESFTTSPDIPESGTDYSVTADLTCVDGQFLSLSVTRDDYSLTTSSAYSNTAGGSITIDIPGDPEGVVDEVKVSSLDPSTGDVTSEKLFKIYLKAANDDPGDDEPTQWGSHQYDAQWYDAIDFCESGTITERLPTIAELQSAYGDCLVERGLSDGESCAPEGFYDTNYWSSETVGDDYAKVFNFRSGSIGSELKDWQYANYTRCIRITE